jgi:cyclohexanecarboxyl-CoA dehydrogenase
MDFAFTSEQDELSRTLRAFARKELAPRSRQWDKTGEFPWEAWRQMGELGLLGFRNPAELGGSEIDLVSIGIAMEEIARGDFSATYGIQLAGLVGQILGERRRRRQAAGCRRPRGRGHRPCSHGAGRIDAANLRAARTGGRPCADWEKSGIVWPWRAGSIVCAN